MRPVLTFSVVLLLSCGRVTYGPEPGQIDNDNDGIGQDWDCDDDDPAISPLVAEVCNGVDDNCNGRVDEDPTDGTLYYADLDQDGYGDKDDWLRSCTPVPNRITVRDDAQWDCNDRDYLVAPDQDETCDPGDQNCDGDADLYAVDGQAWYQDADQDLYFSTTVSVLSCTRPTTWDRELQALPGDDCDDNDRLVNPGRNEVWYDGFDQNCDGLNDFDADLDGFESLVYNADVGAGGGDCDDTNAETYPGAADRWYDGVDSDCDEHDDYDQDDDGYSDEDYGGDDCNDEVSEVHPNAIEIEGDGVDSNCNGKDDR